MINEQMGNWIDGRYLDNFMSTSMIGKAKDHFHDRKFCHRQQNTLLLSPILLPSHPSPCSQRVYSTLIPSLSSALIAHMDSLRLRLVMLPSQMLRLPSTHPMLARLQMIDKMRVASEAFSRDAARAFVNRAEKLGAGGAVLLLLVAAQVAETLIGC